VPFNLLPNTLNVCCYCCLIWARFTANWDLWGTVFVTEKIPVVLPNPPPIHFDWLLPRAFYFLDYRSLLLGEFNWLGELKRSGEFMPFSKLFPTKRLLSPEIGLRINVLWGLKLLTIGDLQLFSKTFYKIDAVAP